MRILVLADIHANWAALRSIQEPYDLCVCAGDLVDYGPDPAPCIAWARENCRYVVRGNHDHCVAQRVETSGESGFRYLAGVTRPEMLRLISEADRQYLAKLPLSLTFRADGLVYHLVHATPRDPLDEYLFGEKEVWERRLESTEADIVCVGHTHHPFVLELGNKRVLNPGSVGQPRDGDPRAAYAVIEDGRIQLCRVEYPIEETIRSLDRLEIPERAKAFAAEVLRSGGGRGDRGNGRGLARGAADHGPQVEFGPAKGANPAAGRETKDSS